MSENWKEKVKRRSGEIIVAIAILALLICLLSMTAPFWNQSPEADEPTISVTEEPSQTDEPIEEPFKELPESKPTPEPSKAEPEPKPIKPVIDKQPTPEPEKKPEIIVPVVKHSHAHAVDTVIAPACTKEGYTVYICSCGDTYNSDYKDALGHLWSEWTVVKQPTEAENGTEKRVCERCGIEESRSIEKLIHSHSHAVESIIEPTCLDKGYSIYVCKCGDTYNADYKDALGHDWSAWETVKKPTTSQKGLEQRTCKRCGEKEERDIDKLPSGGGGGGHSHSYSVDKIVEPTCTEKGYSVYICRCGRTYNADYTDALDHDWDEWTVVEPATEDAEGTEKRVCKRNDSEEERSIEKLTHSHSHAVESIVEPTCTEQGYSVYRCACGNTYNADFTEPLDHDWDEWTVVEPATEDAEGTEKRVCKRNDAEEERSIEKLTHSHSHAVESVVAPTCTEQGYSVYRCACGDTYNADYTEPLDHDWSDWEVTKQPTETEEGTEKRTCSRGDAEEERSIDKLPSEEDPDKLLLIGQWYNGRNHFVTFNEDGTGVFMDGYTSDEAAVVITFNYELMDIEGEEDKEIVFSNLNIIKSEDATVEEMGALERGGRVMTARNYIHISGFMFRTKL